MTTNHTPGPWENMEHSDVVMSQSGWVVAQGGPIGGSRPPDNEAFANARLIAAAPDLLEACKATLNEMRQMHEHHHPHCSNGCPYAEIRDSARSAIAKAEPEPQPC